MAAQYQTRLMASRGAGGVILLEACVSDSDDGPAQVSLFFDPATDMSQVSRPVTGAEVLGAGTIGGAPVLTLAVADPDGFEMGFAGQTLRIRPNRAELSDFAGADAIMAQRNGEDAETVLQWLAYHRTQHGMTAAVILDRARPADASAFDADVAQGLAALDPGLRVLVLRAALPLGKPDTGPESDPINAPAAPGRGRRAAPPPDPWTAPLGALNIYEAIRRRFLARARAVASIEISDLIRRDPAGTVFDRAVAAEGGLIQLTGQLCYPWRTRKSDPVRFGDHICVQFDDQARATRWCIAPALAPAGAVWRMARIGNAAPDAAGQGGFYRFMQLRRPGHAVSEIVPKSSLIEDADLLALAEGHFSHKPVRPPVLEAAPQPAARGRRAIVTTMKNEGPFILEWLAYHRAVGFDDFLVYTNDCTDGTDTLLELLQIKGIVQHRDNPFRQTGLKPQHAALAAAGKEPLITGAEWATCIDVDEFVNIKTGDGTLDALFAAVPEANLISMTWRLFGNADLADFDPAPIIGQFTRCAPELARKPHQAWGFKTLFRNTGIFKKLGVHRPKGLNPQLADQINWVNGSGKPLPETMYRNAWRSTVSTYGYDLVQLNHYAVRSAESFLVKRDRGRVNHVDRDQGLAYWFRMNNNAVEDLSIQRMIPALEAEMATLLADPEIAAAHAACVQSHRAKIDALRTGDAYGAFFAELTGPRMRQLSRLHDHFGANVFLTGPECIPEEVALRDPDETFFFTVERGETQH